MVQAELFEPGPADCGRLAAQHMTWAAKCRRLADAFEARGMETLARWERGTAADHERTADELSMLADFYRLGGVAA